MLHLLSLKFHPEFAPMVKSVNYHTLSLQRTTESIIVCIFFKKKLFTLFDKSVYSLIKEQNHFSSMLYHYIIKQEPILVVIEVVSF